MSAESGLKTFRDSGGLWENYDVRQVASIDGWYADPELVQRFYNERRAQLAEVEPNEAHRIIAGLETDFDVTIVTQNVDNLHERAGSKKVIHLHGELTKACDARKANVTDIGYRPIRMGEKASDGSQLRPFIVWFGEAVPMIEVAAKAVAKADIVVIIGTSMQVYPAAGLVHYAGRSAKFYLIDPHPVRPPIPVTAIQAGATEGMKRLKDLLRHA